MSHTFCRTQKKQKKKTLLYRRLWKKRQHQLTLFCACRASRLKTYASTKHMTQLFCTHYYPCVRNKYMRNYKKMQDFFACFARHQIRHINHVQKNIQRKEEKKWQKEKQAKTQNQQDWNY